MLSATVIFFILTLFSGRCQAECSDDWLTFHGSCYVFINDLATWTGAQMICSLLDSHLVEIETKEENDFIVAQLKLRNVSKIWTGLNDFVREGRFVWSSNMELPEFTNWAAGDPDNVATDPQLGDQDCGAMYINGYWDDDYCESKNKLQFLCEQSSWSFQSARALICFLHWLLGMASGTEGIILQPLWKIHNIDWSDRRNVFETDPSRPGLDLLRRNTIILSRYDVTRYHLNNVNFDRIGARVNQDKELHSGLFYPSLMKWSSFTTEIVRSSA